MTPSPLPARCEVLVVGAGPAGSACATELARAGLDVVLVDAHTFPRDKTCGDGLIPDAHRALRKLGLHEEVMALAQRAGHVGCIGPRGVRIDVPGHLAVLPRRELDHIILRGAERAGARFHAPLRFEAPLHDDGGRVAGAQFKSGASQAEIAARWTVLATGAVPQAAMAAGMCTRRTPSGIALRGYVRNPRMVGRITELEVVWHRKLRPGYGWIFPCRDGVFNIGAGVFDSYSLRRDEAAEMKHVNLRELFARFAEVYPPAHELMATGELVGELKGAPLRCTLDGARWSRPGLLVTGEAAGSTYAFTGEGIGKAMETGMLAARALSDGIRQARADAEVQSAYDASLAALKPRFQLYERANRVNQHPWLADLLIWRARRSARLRQRMAGVLEETSNPGHLVTVKGLVRLFTE